MNLKVNGAQTRSLREMPAAPNFTDLCTFLGFRNVSRKFYPLVAHTIGPMTSLQLKRQKTHFALSNELKSIVFKKPIADVCKALSLSHFQNEIYLCATTLLQEMEISTVRFPNYIQTMSAHLFDSGLGALRRQNATTWRQIKVSRRRIGFTDVTTIPRIRNIYGALWHCLY